MSYAVFIMQMLHSNLYNTCIIFVMVTNPPKQVAPELLFTEKCNEFAKLKRTMNTIQSNYAISMTSEK